MRFRRRKNKNEEPDLANPKAMQTAMKSLQWIFDNRKYEEMMNKEL